MSEFQNDPYRNRELDQSRLTNVVGAVFDFAGVIIDSVKTGAVEAAHVSTTMIHIGTDVLRLDRR